jgi:hypothetical protein
MSLDGLDSPRLNEKDCRFSHWGSGSPRDSVGRFGSSVCFGSVGLLAWWADASGDLGSEQ